MKKNFKNFFKKNEKKLKKYWIKNIFFKQKYSSGFSPNSFCIIFFDGSKIFTGKEKLKTPE